MRAAALTRLAAALAVLLTATALAGGTVIEMRRGAEVQRNIIRMGDVVRIHDTDGPTGDRLAGIYLALAPAPGKAATVTVSDVRRRLRAHGVNLADVVIEGPVTTTVRRPEGGRASVADDEPSPSALADLVRRTVAADLDMDVADVTIAFDRTTALRLRRLSRSSGAGAPAWTVTPEGGAARLGPISVRLEARRKGAVVQRLTVQGTVTATRLVPVAARNIGRYQRITAADLVLERRQVADAAVAALRTDDLIGRRATRAVRKGTVMAPGLVSEVPLVRRGDVVTVIARSPAIQIKTVAVALEEGAAGQAVRVRNMDTKQVFVATVEKLRTVAIGVRSRGESK